MVGYYYFTFRVVPYLAFSSVPYSSLAFSYHTYRDFYSFPIIILTNCSLPYSTVIGFNVQVRHAVLIHCHSLPVTYAIAPPV